MTTSVKLVVASIRGIIRIGLGEAGLSGSVISVGSAV